MEIRAFQIQDESAVVQLWKDCGLTAPQNDPCKDIACKLEIQPEGFLVGCLNKKIIATVMAGYDGHRGWINYLGVHPDHQKSGVGRLIMNAAQNLLKKAGCPKINLQIRMTNHTAVEFYKRMGFVEDDVLSLGKRLDTGPD